MQLVSASGREPIHLQVLCPKHKTYFACKIRLLLQHRQSTRVKSQFSPAKPYRRTRAIACLSGRSKVICQQIVAAWLSYVAYRRSCRKIAVHPTAQDAAKPRPSTVSLVAQIVGKCERLMSRRCRDRTNRCFVPLTGRESSRARWIGMLCVRSEKWHPRSDRRGCRELRQAACRHRPRHPRQTTACHCRGHK